MTYRDRLREIARLEAEGPPRGTKPHHWVAHCERLRLIYAPFPVVRNFETSMPWGGVLVGHNLTGGRTLKRKTEGDAYGGDYHYYGPDRDDDTFT